MDNKETVRTDDAYAQCPYCGEGYQWQSSMKHLIEQSPHNVTCNGEDGCGRDFVVIFEN